MLMPISPGRLFVLRDGAHRFAKLCLIDKQGQRDHDDCRDTQSYQGNAVDRDLPQLDGRKLQDRRKCLLLGAENQQRHILQR